MLTAIAVAVATVGIGPHATRVAGSGLLTIPASELARGEIKFFSYHDDGGREIRFILARDDSGHVHGAMDACQQCAQYHKGYTSSGGYLVCRFCGNRYRVEAKSTGVASCAPIKLPVNDSGANVSVDSSQLTQHRRLF